MIMLNTLLESRAPRPRRMRITMMSALVHAALIAGAVALTTAGPAKATDVVWADTLIVVAPPIPQPVASATANGRTTHSDPMVPALPTIAVPTVVPTSLPSIELGPAVPVDRIEIGGPGVGTTSPIGGDSPLGAGGSAVDEHLVDRAPRLLGRALEPSYPASLRQAGVEGRVVVQFVVDTLGRAEVAELQVIETPHPLFVDAIRSALARYRFSVGEAAGRKVRTRVQMPFEFTLTR
jgi:protein TonB